MTDTLQAHETAAVPASRQAIMDATVAFLLHKPFEQVSMAAIVDAGVSRRPSSTSSPRRTRTCSTRR